MAMPDSTSEPNLQRTTTTLIKDTFRHRPERNVWIVCCFAAIGGFLFGYDVGVLSGCLLMKDFQDRFLNDNISKTLLTSVLMAGAFVGALYSGPLADYLGRKRSIIFGTAVNILGSVIQTAASDTGMMIVGRVIGGLSIGQLSMLVPLYQSEIAPKELRGRLITMQQFAITVGIAVSFWIDFGTLNWEGSSSWRFPMGIRLIPAFILLFGMIFMPYSPRWLMAKGRDLEALKTIAFLRGNGSVSDKTVQMVFTEIKQSVVFEQKYTSQTYWEIFRSGHEHNRRRIWLGIAVQVFQQLTGINVAVYYAADIFQAAGVSGITAALFANGVDGMVNVIATVPTIFFIDKWGRRPTLISGAISCSLCMIILALVLATHGLSDLSTSDTSGTTGNGSISLILDSKGSTVVVMVFLYLFVACYAYSWGPVGWIYPAELYPQRLRAKALGITTAANWLFNFAISQLAPPMLSGIHWGTYLVFAIFCAIMAFIVWLEFPETKGKSLEEIDLIFSGQLKDDDLGVHHPATAAAALTQLERMKFSEKYSNRETSFGNAIEGALKRVADDDAVNNEELELSPLNTNVQLPSTT
ncbi:sugar transporter [Umbelopsis sp. PMI_123]|nr:sugar transporter [Umbelopsis sp. PMI_123]